LLYLMDTLVDICLNNLYNVQMIGELT